jgi:ATP-dependent Clp protease protease subunit
MSALLMAAGARGKRYGLPNSRFVLHQPSMSGLGGEATDIDIHAREILRMRQEITRILAHHSGQLPETISKDIERDYVLNAQQAKEYGLIDDIIYKKEVP